MSHALRAPCGAPPFLPATTTHVSELADRLRETGLVALDGLGSVGGVVARSVVLGFAERIMEITAHRDSDPDGLTTLYDTRRHAKRTGYAGLTNRELAPHTERSGLPRPPRLMLLVCANPAAQGGACLLTDGQAVHAELAEKHPEALDLLSTRHTAYFGGGDGHPTQIFTPHAEGRVSLRLRTDTLARWNPLVTPHLPLLRAVISRHQITLPLLAGQGYLLDNTRWLHARQRFTGDRLCWRALGEPHPAVLPLPMGFLPVPTGPQLPPTTETS
ncbi:TauD/TfdA family dioxygenase [Streptomyces sp. NPDC059928]|uniref:TauD/TfdA family dioxygenase n=1 Tax=unclassified Streptomyces TaxID=2593676 RepID=UPI0036611C30